METMWTRFGLRSADLDDMPFMQLQDMIYILNLESDIQKQKDSTSSERSATTEQVFAQLPRTTR